MNRMKGRFISLSFAAWRKSFFDTLNAPLFGEALLFMWVYTLNFRSMIWAVTTYMTAAKARSMQPYTSREV